MMRKKSRFVWKRNNGLEGERGSNRLCGGFRKSPWRVRGWKDRVPPTHQGMGVMIEGALEVTRMKLGKNKFGESRRARMDTGVEGNRVIGTGV
jgi:hypothetical protein